MANILIVGPHPDDQELGMGGTIALLAHQGHDVLLVDMTDGEPTPFGTPAIRAREAAKAARLLGVKRKRVQLGLPNRRVEHTVAARHALAGVIRLHQANVLFVPHFEDAHPDHLAVTRIAHDARFDAKLTRIDLPGQPIYPHTLIHYYCTHLRTAVNPTFCIDMSAQMPAKLRAIKAYRSQFVVNKKNRRVLTWLEQLNGYMGSRIGVEYAEPFFAREPLGLRSLDGLVI